MEAAPAATVAPPVRSVLPDPEHEQSAPTEFLSTTVEHKEVPNAYAGKQFVMASLRAPKFEPVEGKRSKLRLVAVLDRSGSMASDAKMQNVKESIEFFVRRVLRPEDEFAIVSYDNVVEVPLALTRADKLGVEKALAAVKSLEPRSTTNLSGGLFKGLELVQGATDKDITAVLLFTDGLANHGVQDTATIKTLTENLCSSAQQPPSVFTFGFGKDHNEDMLRGIAECGKGTYYFIKGKDDIPQAFGDCFGGLTSVVAQNIKLKFEPGAAGVVVSKVHSARPAVPTPGGGFEVDVGDLYSEEHRDVLCEIQLPAQREPSTESAPVVRITCTCLNVTTASAEMHKVVASIARPETSTSTRDISIDMHSNRINVVHAIEAATQAADRGNLAEGRALLDAARVSVAGSPSASTEMVVNLLRDIDQIQAGMVEREHYARYTCKMSKARMMSHMQQRCNHSNYASELGENDEATEAYTTTSKMQMKSMFKRR